MESVMMNRETMLSKIPLHLVESVKNKFSKAELASKTVITRYTIEEQNNGIKIIGYDGKGRSFTVVETLQKIYRSDIDSEGNGYTK